MKKTILLFLFLGASNLFAQMATGVYNSEGIELQNNVTWTPDFSTQATWESTIHYILGYNAGTGFADVQWNWADGFGCGVQANGNTGYVVYKFKCPSGYVTSRGGEVKGQFTCQYASSEYVSNYIFGINDKFEPYTDNLYIKNIGNWNIVTPKMPENNNGIIDNEPYLSLPIPPNLSEFYVVIAETGCSGRFGIWNKGEWTENDGLKVTVPMKEKEIPVVLWDGPDNPDVLRHRERLYNYNNDIMSQDLRWYYNEIGMNGTRLGMSAVVDNNYDTIEQSVMRETVNYGKKLGITQFAYRVNWDVPTFSAQSWTDQQEWNNVYTSMHKLGELLKYTGINTVFFDVEDYPLKDDNGEPIEDSFGNWIYNNSYIFHSFEWGSDAHDRGRDIAGILQSYCPDLTIIIIPELGASSSTYSHASFKNSGYNRFIKGMLANSPHIKVLVGTENTYGNHGDSSDSALTLKMNPWPHQIYTYTNTTHNELYERLKNYIINVDNEMRDFCDYPLLWDQYGGVAAGFVPFKAGTKNVSNYHYFLFGRQMDAFKDGGAKLMWDWEGCRFPWKSWEGMTSPDSDPTHPDLDKYIIALKQRGTTKINTDYFQDLIVVTDNNLLAIKSNGDTFDAFDDLADPFQTWYANPYSGTKGTFFADVTGDGKADAIAVNDTGIAVRKSSGNDFNHFQVWYDKAYYGSKGTYFADVTGDDMADAIVVNDTGIAVRKSSGNDFNHFQVWYDKAYYGSKGTYFADVTGDGKADAIVVNDTGIAVRKSSGNDFNHFQVWYDKAYYGSKGTYFADVTGDRKADAIVVNDTGIAVRKSSGNDFNHFQVWYDTGFFGTVGTYFVDITGDGKADAIAVNENSIIVKRSLGSCFGTSEVWSYMQNQSFYSDAMTISFANIDDEIF